MAPPPPHNCQLRSWWWIPGFAIILVALVLSEVWRRKQYEGFMTVQATHAIVRRDAVLVADSSIESDRILRRRLAGTFVLQDVTTHRSVTYIEDGRRLVLDADRPVVHWLVRRDGAIYDSEQGAVGLFDVLAGMSMRHSDNVLTESPSTSSSKDSAWAFLRTDTPHVYTLFSFSGTNQHLGYDDQRQQLTVSDTSPARRWRVRGDDAARTAVMDASLETQPGTIVLQDVTTGQKVTCERGGTRILLDPGQPVVHWSVLRDGSVFNNDQGAIGLIDTATNMCMRHNGYMIQEYPYSFNNIDSAWLFHATDTPNVYTVFNFFGSDEFLGYDDGRHQLNISNGQGQRRWKVIGDAPSLTAIFNAAAFADAYAAEKRAEAAAAAAAAQRAQAEADAAAAAAAAQRAQAAADAAAAAAAAQRAQAAADAAAAAAAAQRAQVAADAAAAAAAAQRAQASAAASAQRAQAAAADGKPGTFIFQDVETGQIVSYAQDGQRVVFDTTKPVVHWSILRSGSVYNNGKGAVGLYDSVTFLCMRHMGFRIYAHGFGANNFDFAWVFKRTDTPNVYTLFNFYGANEYLGYDGQQQLLISNSSPPRKWRVLGDATALSNVYNVSS